MEKVLKDLLKHTITYTHIKRSSHTYIHTYIADNNCQLDREMDKTPRLYVCLKSREKRRENKHFTWDLNDFTHIYSYTGWCYLGCKNFKNGFILISETAQFFVNWYKQFTYQSKLIWLFYIHCNKSCLVMFTCKT